MKKNVSFCLIIHSLINLIFNPSSRDNAKNMKPALGVAILLKNTAEEKNILTEIQEKKYEHRLWSKYPSNGYINAGQRFWT